MLHKQVATTVEATEAGTFVALAAAYTVDRSNERVMPGAFSETIKRWREVGRNVPLHWDHESDPESIVAPSIPLDGGDLGRSPGRSHPRPRGVGPRRQVWRLVKSDSVGLSFGYLVTDERERGDVRELHKIDLFEVSLTPAPMNPRHASSPGSRACSRTRSATSASFYGSRNAPSSPTRSRRRRPRRSQPSR